MSELGSVIDAYRSESLAELPDARIEQDFAELQRGVEALELERLRRLGEIDRRRLYARDGYLSAVAWLGARHRVAWGTASGDVGTARALEAMPATRRALAEAEVSLSAARVLVAARDASPEAFTAAEPTLVEAARIHRIQDLRRVVAHWRDAVERERAAGGEDRLRARRRLHASVLLDGMVRVDADLDPDNGRSLLAALGAVADAESRAGTADDRTPPQRRADALGEVCRQWLDRGDRPAVAGERPHVSVVLGLEDLEGPRGTSGERAPTGAVPPQVPGRLGIAPGSPPVR